MNKLNYFLLIALFATFVACNKDEDVDDDDNNTTPKAAKLIVNELMTKPLTQGLYFLDAQGDYSDWVEFLNTGDTAINIAGYWLTDRGEDAPEEEMWQIPTGNDAITTIAAGARLVVIFGAVDANGVDMEGFVDGKLHCPKGLSVTKDNAVAIFNSSKTLVAASEIFNADGPFGVLADDKSLGRTTDGATTWKVFDVPTPGAANQ